MDELFNVLSMIWNLVRKIDFIALVALIIAGKTYHSQQFGIEVIVYPYQEKYGDYGIAIENIGKGTAVDYTFKVLGYDENTKTKIKDFLDTYKLLNGQARITLAGGKIHKIKIGNQGIVKINREKREAAVARGEEQGVETEDFPTIEIQVQKRKHNRHYEVITNSIVCDLKAFADYPYTEEPNELLRQDMKYIADKKARTDNIHRNSQIYKDRYK